MQEFLKAFERIKTKHGKQLLDRTQLHCKVGTYGGSVVLKLQKATWTNDNMDVVPNTSGIFFAIWLEEKGFKKSRAFYNVEALKMRHLKGYRVRNCNALMSDFRREFSVKSAVWPNLNLNSGCLMWMQGWFSLDPKTFEADTWQLMNHFIALSPTIDSLLEQTRAAS